MRGRAHVGLRPVALFAIMGRSSGAWAGPALRCLQRLLEKCSVSELQGRIRTRGGRDRARRVVSGIGNRRTARPFGGGSTAFGLTIDRPGGADLDLCERIAARLNATLEACGAPYTLEVESAGLERPLVRPADYTRFAGRRARDRNDAQRQRQQDPSRNAARRATAAVILETDAASCRCRSRRSNRRILNTTRARISAGQTTTERKPMATTEAQ